MERIEIWINDLVKEFSDHGKFKKVFLIGKENKNRVYDSFKEKGVEFSDSLENAYTIELDDYFRYCRNGLERIELEKKIDRSSGSKSIISSQVNLVELSTQVKKTMIEQGIVSYVRERASPKIDYIVLKGNEQNVNFIFEYLLTFKDLDRVYLSKHKDENKGSERKWTIDVDDLLRLYSTR